MTRRKALELLYLGLPPWILLARGVPLSGHCPPAVRLSGVASISAGGHARLELTGRLTGGPAVLSGRIVLGIKDRCATVPASFLPGRHPGISKKDMT